MSLRRLHNVPAMLSLAAMFAMGIMLLGGCPQQQIPGPPADNDDDNEQIEQPDQGEQERPIPPPDIDGDDDDGEPQPPSNGGGGTPVIPPGGGGGGGGTTALAVQVDEPASPLAVRPGTNIPIKLTLSDRNGTLSKAELVLAYDKDRDGEPDGDPQAAQPIELEAGDNNVEYDTAQTAALLTNGYGTFVVGVRTTTSFGGTALWYAPALVSIDSVPPNQGLTAKDAWISPAENALTNPRNWTIKLRTQDNSPHKVQILLDEDSNPANGFAGLLLPETEFAAGSATREFNPYLGVSSGTYYYYVTISDGIDPPTAFYAPSSVPGGPQLVQVMVTERMVGVYDLNRLDPSRPEYDNATGKSRGAILQGFNFNDLAGSAIMGVPDLNDDGFDELVAVSRFGKPRVSSTTGVGWGEGYLVRGTGQRLRGRKPLNSVGAFGASGIDGLVFTGIRAPRSTSWSEGLSDVTFVPDMDGDELPDLVFSFPRVESISLWHNPWQYDELSPYATGMGTLEYDPSMDLVDTDGAIRQEVQVDGHTWLKNRTQFTRGGIVIVSSQNVMLADRNRLSPRGTRVIDLHETGQFFNNMNRGEVRPVIERVESQTLIEECPGNPDPVPTEYEEVKVFWDVMYRFQGPGGFDNWKTHPDFVSALNPPLANMWNDTPSLDYINTSVLLPIDVKCDAPNCVLTNEWDQTKCNPFPLGTGSLYFPAGSNPASDSGFLINTGFYGWPEPESVAPRPETVGARVLGQLVNDKFGAAVSSDRSWLYMSAPGHGARKADVPNLTADRDKSGVVYMYQIETPSSIDGVTTSQLWIEPGTRWVLDPDLQEPDPEDPESYIEETLAWPHVDVHRLAILDVDKDRGTIDFNPNRGSDHQDFPMPVPHTYIIDDIGSQRGRDYFWPDEWARLNGSEPFVEETRSLAYNFTDLLPGDSCAQDQLRMPVVEGGVRSVAPCVSPEWPSGGVFSSTYWMGRAAQIVGPHPGAQLSFVRTVGDIDNDGVDDFAVGSENIKSDIVNGTGDLVGAVFIVFGRIPGLQGDVLLENLALPINAPGRLTGVVLKGTASNERLARTFDKAGNFNGDPFGDVVVGNEVGSNGKGEAVVILGSSWLQSPEGGWTVDEAVQAGVAVRFVGEKQGDLAGANVAHAGDVDADGRDDILVAAPGAEGGRGAVYLIYGSNTYQLGMEISLSKIGTFDLPGVKFIGRIAGDALGGGKLVYGDSDPQNPNGAFYLNPDQLAVTVYSDGVAAVGDLDNDGNDDFAISSMLADPYGRRDAGEVYVIYGSGD